MKTRPPDAAGKPALPPPPAPTSRDANPWPMSSGSAAPSRVRRHPRMPDVPRGTPAPAGADPRRPRRTRWMPLAVLLFIAGLGVQMVLVALERGEWQGAIGALVMLAMVALMVVRLVRRRRR